MSNEIVLSETLQLGEVFYKSGLFQDVKSAAQSVVKILAGRELGISPIISMTKINIIKGKIALSAEMMGSLIKKSGEYDYMVESLTDKECILKFYKGDKEIGESKFTWADAERIKSTDGKPLTAGTNWTNYPRNMLLARALSNGARWFTPHLIAGVYTPDEFGIKVDDTGEAIKTNETTASIPAVITAAEKARAEDILDEPLPASQPTKPSSPEIADDIYISEAQIKLARHWMGQLKIKEEEFKKNTGISHFHQIRKEEFDTVKDLIINYRKHYPLQPPLKPETRPVPPPKPVQQKTTDFEDAVLDENYVGDTNSEEDIIL